jgi:hypothetical protein
MAVTGDGHTPDFENMPWGNFRSGIDSGSFGSHRRLKIKGASAGFDLALTRLNYCSDGKFIFAVIYAGTARAARSILRWFKLRKNSKPSRVRRTSMSLSSSIDLMMRKIGFGRR